jgi:hypothetical protein
MHDSGCFENQKGRNDSYNSFGSSNKSIGGHKTRISFGNLKNMNKSLR